MEGPRQKDPQSAKQCALCACMHFMLKTNLYEVYDLKMSVFSEHQHEMSHVLQTQLSEPRKLTYQ